MADRFNKEEFYLTFDEKDVVKKIEVLDQYWFDRLTSAYGGGASTSGLHIKSDLLVVLSESNYSTGSSLLVSRQ